MRAIIMAGGHGTRIRSVASDIPKPMIPVLEKPVLEYQIENLKACGITDITLITGYLSAAIHEYFGDGSRFGVQIRYFNEDVPMGTAGALYYLKEELNEDFLLLMGDLMLSVDFVRFMEEHKKHDAAVTLFVHPNSHPYDSDVIVLEEKDNISAFLPDAKPDTDLSHKVASVISKKAERNFYYRNMVNAGIYAMGPEALKRVAKPEGIKVDLDKDVIRPLIEEGRVYACHSTEYVKDMGTPDRYEEVTEAVRTGLTEKRNLSHKQRCVFIDRDGTLNVYKGFLHDPSAMELEKRAAEAIRKLNSSEYLAIVVTNQPVIARGELSFEGLSEMHKKLETDLGKEGAFLDDILYCPHHKDKGFAGEIPELKFACRCRKPEDGMLQTAAEKYNIDLSRSFMIGDMTQDIACGKRAGLRTVLVKTGKGGEDGKYAEQPDQVCEDLLSAVEWILASED